MLQRDYILVVINQFVNAIMQALHKSLDLSNPEEAKEAAEDAELAIAGLLDLDPSVAMQLTPESLVTMMVLSGMGDTVANYVAYSLNALGTLYDKMGDAATAAIRREQAAAVGESFGCDPTVPPEELVELEQKLNES